MADGASSSRLLGANLLVAEVGVEVSWVARRAAWEVVVVTARYAIVGAPK